jgi:hypothetical protein
VATLKGTYVVLEQGWFLVPFPGVSLTPPFPVVLTANPTYDGAGDFSGTFSVNIGGQAVPGTFSGTYTVNSDCTYSDSFTTSVGTTGHHAGAIAGKGMFQEIQYIYTDPVLVVAGTAKRK